jgi:hypothetical protein
MSEPIPIWESILDKIPIWRIEEVLRVQKGAIVFNVWEDEDGIAYVAPAGCSMKRIPRKDIEGYLAARKERAMSDTTEGPWRAENNHAYWAVTANPYHADAARFFCGRVHDQYAESEAEALARAEADRLNARWRAEQKERERAEAKARAIAAFVAKYKTDHYDWFWEPYYESRSILWVDESGDVYIREKRFDMEPDRIAVPRAELEAALIAAGVPRPVALTDELRRRLMRRLEDGGGFYELLRQDVQIGPNGGCAFSGNWSDIIPCTPDHCRAFLSEIKSKMGVET